MSWLLSYPSAWKDSSSWENCFYPNLFLPSLPPSFPPSLLPSFFPSFLPSCLPSFLPPSLPSFLSQFFCSINSQLLVLTQLLVKVNALICCSRLVSWGHTSSLGGMAHGGLWRVGLRIFDLLLARPIEPISPPALTASTPCAAAPFAPSLRSLTVPGSLGRPSMCCSLSPLSPPWQLSSRMLLLMF